MVKIMILLKENWQRSFDRELSYRAVWNSEGDRIEI